MKAMILAAGFGTRLFPLTIDRTKPAIPFLGKPLVGYVAEYVAKYGFDEIVVNLHHQPDSVKQALGDGEEFGVTITYTHEVPEILGTSGALDNARKHLESGTFIVVNGKIVTDIDIAAALETHKRLGAIATMVLRENEKFEKFTEVFVQNEEVKGFASGFPIENPKSHLSIPLMFTGIQILEPEVFEYIPRNVYSDIVPSFYLPAIADGRKIAAHVCGNRWFELSTIPRYLDISLEMMNADKVFKGANCKIASNASVANSVIWDDVTIGENTTINRAIIADGVTIPEGAHFEDVAIVTAEMLKHCDDIPEKALNGEYVGANYVVSLIQ
ncbi:MAG: sugar phosphate nucleotidyltransferase [Pyrinomonadaceae bacterium]